MECLLLRITINILLLTIDNLSIVNNKILIDGTISSLNDASINMDISVDGELVHSETMRLRNSNGITVLPETSSQNNIISCVLEESANEAWLFPVNSSFAHKLIITMAIRNGNGIIYFEGLLPESINYSELYNQLEDFEEIEICEQDTIINIETWKSSVSSGGEKEPQIPIDTLSINATSPVAGVPVGVFTETGRWMSVNNPNNPTIGYYAYTYSLSGTTTLATDLLKWEYIYTPCNNFTSGSVVAPDGSISLRIRNSSQYTYYPSTNQIIETDDFIPFRIKNAAIAMGLRSKYQILSNATMSIQSNSTTISINWKAFLGLLPKEVAYSTAQILFNAISFEDDNTNNVSGTYQSTADGQMDAYGKLIRGNKFTSNDKALYEPGDHLTINYTVRQPNDLTIVSGTYYIDNKFYFEIYERNAITFTYTDRLENIEQFRTDSYNVY